MDSESSVPPGFRFHPTEEELVGYYLKRKINYLKIDLDVIVEIDLYKIEPWDIQDRCKLGYDEQNEWYFFSHKDKKYPTGTRTNRATVAGFWKATGRDKAVISKDRIIGMRKTLVFYKGRAPNGWKTDWIMHEYRLQTSEHAPPQEEGWVVCRAFRKPTPSQRPGLEAWNQAFLRYQNYARPPSFSPSDNVIVNESTLSTHLIHPTDHAARFRQQFMSEEQVQLVQDHVALDSQHIELPPLDSPNTPTISTSLATEDNYNDGKSNNINYSGYLCLDWKSLDNLLASQMTDSTYYQPSTSKASMIPHNHEMQAQSHNSSVLGCYPADS